jgi:glutathione S-transferase
LEEINAKYQRYEIDLQAKPDWYAPKINPASKVPAIAYGGPVVPPDQPSPESLKVNESLILLEFINDIDPEHRLLPKDPETRVRVRLFIDAVGSKLAPKWYLSSIKGDSLSNLMEGLETIQTYLSPENKYAIGNEFTMADITILPFLARADLSLRHDVGAFPMGAAPAAYDLVQNDEKFATLRQYFNTLKERESFKKTFDPVRSISFPTLRDVSHAHERCLSLGGTSSALHYAF